MSIIVVPQNRWSRGPSMRPHRHSPTTLLLSSTLLFLLFVLHFASLRRDHFASVIRHRRASSAPSTPQDALSQRTNSGSSRTNPKHPEPSAPAKPSPHKLPNPPPTLPHLAPLGIAAPHPLAGQSFGDFSPLDWTLVRPSLFNLFQSTANKGRIPKKVRENILHFAPEYVRFLVDDDDIIQFFDTFSFGQEYIDKFRGLKFGSHKGDFFRYSVLELFGGVWVDEDMQPVATLSEKVVLAMFRWVSFVFSTLFVHLDSFLLRVFVLPSSQALPLRETGFYSVFQEGHGGVLFQAFISVPPGHELMRAARDTFFATPHEKLAEWANLPTKQIADLLRDRGVLSGGRRVTGGCPQPKENQSKTKYNHTGTT